LVLAARAKPEKGGTAMKKLAIALAAAAMLGVAVPASAQGVYFGPGYGYRGWWGGPGYGYRSWWGGPRARVYVYPRYRYRYGYYGGYGYGGPYGAYGYRGWWGGY